MFATVAGVSADARRRHRFAQFAKAPRRPRKAPADVERLCALDKEGAAQRWLCTTELASTARKAYLEGPRSPARTDFALARRQPDLRRPDAPRRQVWIDRLDCRNRLPHTANCRARAIRRRRKPHPPPPATARASTASGAPSTNAPPKQHPGQSEPPPSGAQLNKEGLVPPSRVARPSPATRHAVRWPHSFCCGTAEAPLPCAHSPVTNPNHASTSHP
jgi:hypothetical protein